LFENQLRERSSKQQAMLLPQLMQQTGVAVEPKTPKKGKREERRTGRQKKEREVKKEHK